MAPGFRFLSQGIKTFLLLLLPLFTYRAAAEGSKELTNNGGTRAFLVSGTTVTASYVFPTNGTMKVYAKVGEVINAGSAAQGIGFGTINLRSPNGATYTSGTSTTVGFIANRAQEVAGPQPTAGGYTPYTHTVLAGEEGVWEVDFVAVNGGVPGGENPAPLPVNNNWPQPSGQYIPAFDVSVRNIGGTAFLTGRVYTNIFSGILGTFDVGFNGIFRILTKDGYIYTLDNNGQAGNGFSFFANNKGFRWADGSALYQSVNTLNNPNIQDPRAADTGTDITHKIFFNPPAPDLPASANTPGGGNTWLLNAVVAPALTNITFTGLEGTPNLGGVAPLGGAIGFNANKNGIYTIIIDVDKNGVYTDTRDRKLIGLINEGSNQVAWDGLDALGAKVAAGTGYTASISVVLYGGEVHFPFFDVERNINGIKLTRLNGPSAPDFTVYWNDSPITQTGTAGNAITPSNPIVNTTGINSQINGHKWGAPGSSDIEFGNEKGLDTWTYIASTTLTGNVNIQLREADLEVGSINANASGGCIGQQVSYTFTVKNNGPNDVTGAKLTFSYPTDLTAVVVTSAPTTNISAVSNAVTGTTGYSATLNLNNGAVRTFSVTGKVTTMPASGSVTVTAAVLRPADMTDPDATNPDAAAPVDPADECNSAPSGTGCNNVKSNTLAFIAPPSAGPDQTVFITETATITATGTGTWSQIGNTPALAVITTPPAQATTITGLNAVGQYAFLRTNATGCTDTVVVNVVPRDISVPTVITPNGDGKNDNFTIPNIGLFPGSKLMIYNRWGNEVYHSDDYRNTWDGGTLSEGTYFYVLQRKETSGAYTIYKGWLFLKR